MRNLESIALALMLGLGTLALAGVVQAEEATGAADQTVADQAADQAAPDQSTIDQSLSPQAIEAMGSGIGEDLPSHKLVMTENETRAYRLKLWAALLRGDMKDVYNTYGAPSTRYRESTMGRVVEKWVYAGRGKEFSFEGGKLGKTVDFRPGSR
jgi:hypothetical protein